MPLSIRPADEADLPILARMNKHLVEDERNVNPMSIDQLQRRMEGWLKGDWRIDLLVEDGEVVGYALYQFRTDEYFPERTVVYLRHFYVERGRRNRGLGREAFETLWQTRFPTADTVVLDVLATNPSGHRFWSGLGFQAHCTTMKLRREDRV